MQLTADHVCGEILICINFLTENHQLINSPKNAAIAQYLLDVGSGKCTCTEPDGSITLPAGMCCGDTIDNLISCIYPNISDLE